MKLIKRVSSDVWIEAFGLLAFLGGISCAVALLYTYAGWWAAGVLLSLTLSLLGVTMMSRERDSAETERDSSGTGRDRAETGENERDWAQRLVDNPGAFLPGPRRD